MGNHFNTEDSWRLTNIGRNRISQVLEARTHALWIKVSLVAAIWKSWRSMRGNQLERKTGRHQIMESQHWFVPGKLNMLFSTPWSWNLKSFTWGRKQQIVQENLCRAKLRQIRGPGASQHKRTEWNDLFSAFLIYYFLSHAFVKASSSQPHIALPQIIFISTFVDF